MTKRIVFCQHAVFQIEKRKIAKVWILQTLDKPDQQLPSFRSRRLHQKRFAHRILEVVSTAEADSIVIITAYYLKNL